MINEIEERKKALKEEIKSLEIEELRLQRRYGVCLVCGEEKQWIDQLSCICYDCRDQQRREASKEHYAHLIGKKITCINAEPKYFGGVPSILSIELEGGYEITVEAWSDPLGMKIGTVAIEHTRQSKKEAEK